ncbi:hypothetical protein BS47DRAFT_1488854 [Hydnum rufescens UP504]|uniref:Uncharacterized protein n=1 Tax=Hydnum rufescens UP504 TaxID=1448309 RepID=A0A9P6ALA4_9AGAM|nr:hypothetical protein BS47DRAFT_1488854 [Hydnum rufescens UP504]
MRLKTENIGIIDIPIPWSFEPLFPRHRGHRGPTTDVTPPMSVALVSYEGWGNSQGKVLAVVTAQTDFHFLCEESCDRHLAWGGPVDTKVKRAEKYERIWLSLTSRAEELFSAYNLPPRSLAPIYFLVGRGIAAKLCTFKISRLYTGFTAKELPFTVQDYGHPPRPRTVNAITRPLPDPHAHRLVTCVSTGNWDRNPKKRSMPIPTGGRAGTVIVALLPPGPLGVAGGANDADRYVDDAQIVMRKLHFHERREAYYISVNVAWRLMHMRRTSVFRHARALRRVQAKGYRNSDARHSLLPRSPSPFGIITPTSSYRLILAAPPVVNALYRWCDDEIPPPSIVVDLSRSPLLAISYTTIKRTACKDASLAVAYSALHRPRYARKDFHPRATTRPRSEHPAICSRQMMHTNGVMYRRRRSVDSGWAIITRVAVHKTHTIHNMGPSHEYRYLSYERSGT